MTAQIGTVEVLRTRVYPLDPEMGHEPLATTVVVEPGVYPLHRDLDAYYWMMTGHLNARGSTKIGDGLFTMANWDEASGPEVTFPSRRYGPDQWADFLAEDTCTEGHPQQRLRISIDESVEMSP
jgi:hypothetical protein